MFRYLVKPYCAKWEDGIMALEGGQFTYLERGSFARSAPIGEAYLSL